MQLCFWPFLTIPVASKSKTIVMFRHVFRLPAVLTSGRLECHVPLLTRHDFHLHHLFSYHQLYLKYNWRIVLNTVKSRYLEHRYQDTFPIIYYRLSWNFGISNYSFRAIAFYLCGQQLCKFIGTKESVCIRKELNSHRIGLVQHDKRKCLHKKRAELPQDWFGT